MLYSNSSKAQRMLTHFAARWRQKSELFQNWHRTSHGHQIFSFVTQIL